MSFESLTAGAVLPEFHVSASAPVEPHENKIHEDDLARQYGFKGGLVPGVTVYAWMTHPVVEALGVEWLERGEFQARFAKPIYYEEPATIRARVASLTGDAVTIEVAAHNSLGEVCGTATMTLGSGGGRAAGDARANREALREERPRIRRGRSPAGGRRLAPRRLHPSHRDLPAPQGRLTSGRLDGARPNPRPCERRQRQPQQREQE